jgi:phosphate transport system substrate-binding protein
MAKTAVRVEALQALGCAIGLLMAACRGGSEKQAEQALSGKVRLFGSGTAIAVVAPMVEAFRAKHPAVTLEIEESSSRWALGYARQGMVDIGLSTLPPGPGDEGLVARAVARDGLCLIVHRDNPVAALSDDQIRGIFTGTVANWKEVGGPDRAITRINHADVRTPLALFSNYLGISPSRIKYADIVISSDAEAVRHVSNKPEAVTYTSIAIARSAVMGGSPIRLLGFGGVEPTPENVAAGRVPIVYDVLLVTRGEPQGVVKAFVEFASSPAVREIVTTRNFVLPPA